MRLRTIAAVVALSLAVAAAPAGAKPSPAPRPGGPVELVHADGTRFTALAATGSDGAWSLKDPAGAPVVRAARSQALAVNCAYGYVCMYLDDDANGWRLEVQSGIGVLNFAQLPCGACQSSGKHPDQNGTFNDQASSWRNDTGRRYCWYFDAYRSGEWHPMESQGSYTQNLPPHESDEASSLAPC